MPRNPSNVYSKPAGTTFTPNTVIESAKVNELVDDIVADLNLARPITAGGTGATSAAAARSNLGVDNTVGTITANYTVTVGDRGDCVNANATSGAITVTLPAAATADNGFTLVVKKTDSTTNTVTIDAAGSETIDGALTRVLRFQHQSVALICNGSAWFVLSEGSIFETGTNANGDYIRYANGWQICTKEISPGIACATAAGNIFFSSGVVAGSFAAAFNAVPVVSLAGTSGSGNGWTLQSVIQTSTTWGTYRHANYASDANTGGKIYLTANGRWF